jgi:hypothetical protein
MWEDPIVAEVRRAREELSARFDFDVKAIFADLRNRQGAFGARLLFPKNRPEPTNEVVQGTPSTLEPSPDSPASADGS